MDANYFLTGMMLQVPCKPWPLQIECHQLFFSCRAVFVLRCGILSNIGLVMMLWRWVVILYGVFRRTGRCIQSISESYSLTGAIMTSQPTTPNRNKRSTTLGGVGWLATKEVFEQILTSWDAKNIRNQDPRVHPSSPSFPGLSRNFYFTGKDPVVQAWWFAILES